MDVQGLSSRSWCAALIGLAAGCASPDFAVRPRYQAAAASAAASGGQAIQLAVKDLRQTRGKGTASGGETLAQGTKGSVSIEVSCAEILRRSLTDALGAAGLRLGDDAPVLVEAELRRLVLEAKQFTDWKLDSETGSTLDLLRIVVPGKQRETSAEIDVLLRVRKPGWDAGFSHLIQRRAAKTEADRSVVEMVLSEAFTAAVDATVAAAVRDVPRTAALPVSNAEFREREAAIARQQHELDALRRGLDERQRALRESREEFARLGAAGDARDAAIAQKLAALEARDAENIRLGDSLRHERERLAEERSELGGWRAALDRGSEAPPPPTIAEPRPPVVVVTNPLAAATTTTRGQITVEGVAFSHQRIQSVDCFVNGQKLGTERAVPIGMEAEDDATYRRFSRSPSLAEGVNRIAIRATDGAGFETAHEFAVEFRKPAGRVHIVAVGIDSYQHRAIPALQFAVKDAVSVTDSFRAALGVGAGENVEVLTNEGATARAIRLALGARLLLRESKEDTVIIYFSGHGGIAPNSSFADGCEKYLLTYDADASDYPATALSMHDVGKLFDRLESERVIFLADTCYSGAAGGRTIKPAGVDFRALPAEGAEKRLGGSGRVIMTASAASEVAQEMADLGHGVFTHFLLRAIGGREADGDGDRRLTIAELYGFVSQQVREKTGGTQNPQISNHLGGEISFPLPE